MPLFRVLRAFAVVFEAIFSGRLANGCRHIRARLGSRGLLGRSAVVAALMLAAVFAAGVGVGAGPVSAAGRLRSDAGSAGSTGSAAGLAPANIVIAVDESGSITTDKMAQEKAAATSIVYDEFDQRSSVEVIGFGGRTSQESATNPQSPTICPMTPLSSPVQRGSVQTCVSGLASRNDKQGNNTDFNEVLGQATADLRSAPAGYQRLVFLLTDGEMHVYNPNTGPDDATRLARAILVNKTIPDALAAHVSIWGLGFGTDAKLDDLTPMAQNSYQDQCTANRAQLVPNIAETRTTLLAQFFASARCAVFKQGVPQPLVPGKTVDYPVDIPVIATSGAIEVLTGDPRDKVVFEDPQTHPVLDVPPVGGAHYELEGSGGVIQTLQITDPPPGRWHVMITSPAGSPVQSVAADVLWQGRLSSDIVVDADPVPGRQVGVDVELIASRQGALTADSLKDVKVVAGMSGTGFDPVTTPLQADPGRPGLYHGNVLVPPNAKGTLTLTGLVTGPGVAAQQNVSYPPLRVPGAGSVNASFIIHSTTVHPGEDFTVLLQLENQSGRPHTLTVGLRDAQAGVTLRQPTVPLSSDSGVRPPVPLVIHVDGSVHPGRVTGALSVADAATNQQYTSTFLPVDIVPTPSFTQKYGAWIALVVGLIVAGIFALAWAIRGRLRNADVRDITMTLRDHNDQVYEHLPAPSIPATRFPFGVVQPGDEGGEGRLVRVGGTQCVARRRRNGLMISCEGREPEVLYVGQHIVLSDDVILGYEDNRVSHHRTSLLDRLLGGRDPETTAVPDEDSEAPGVV